MLPTVNKTHLAGRQTSGNTCRLEMVCQGRTKEGTYPTVLTCWGLSLPCFLHPHSRASTLHRRWGPAQEPSGPPPFCPAPGSTHLLPTASPRAPPSSSLKSIMRRALKHHLLRCWRVSSVLQGLMPALHGGCDVTPESGYSLEPKLEV